jgi:hypothetical protein
LADYGIWHRMVFLASSRHATPISSSQTLIQAPRGPQGLSNLLSIVLMLTPALNFKATRQRCSGREYG